MKFGTLGNSSPLQLKIENLRTSEDLRRLRVKHNENYVDLTTVHPLAHI
jgi:hypothetical protein